MRKLKKDLELENQMLKDRLANLETTKETVTQEEDIAMNKLIKVVSLYTGVLNLKTSNQSDATVFTFNFFGYEQPIFYSDLIRCVNNQRRFFVDGFCMIQDEKFIRLHYLEKAYKSLLTKDEILNFIEMDKEFIESKYLIIPQQQKITVLEMVASKINTNEYIDKNKIDILANISKVDLNELAEKLK